MLPQLFALVVLATVTMGKEMDVSTKICRPGFSKFRNHCFFVGTNKVSWYDAMLICKHVVGPSELAEITDMPLRTYLQDLIQNKGDYGEFWVGGTNIPDNSTYIWNKSRKDVNKALWDENEPNNTNGAEHCTELRRNGYLNDNDCHAYRMYICEQRLT